MLTKALLAFIVGGLFCAFAQILIDKTKLTPARILVFYVTFGVFLGAVGAFPPLFNLAGTGATLPLVGFGANVAKGVREAVDARGVMGILGGAFSASSVGCTTALISGFLASLFFKGKSKRL